MPYLPQSQSASAALAGWSAGDWSVHFARSVSPPQLISLSTKKPMHHASCAASPCASSAAVTPFANETSHGSRNFHHMPWLPAIGRDWHSTRSAYGVRLRRQIARSLEFAMVFMPQLRMRRWQRAEKVS